MVRTFTALTLAFAVATAASGQATLQDELAPEPGADAPRCGEFVTLDSLRQIQVLSTIQPLGDEIDPNDADAARQWADEVTRACGDHRDRPVADAAREALGE